MRVLVFGTFDRLHKGHEDFLRQAQRRGTLSVVVARDSNVEKIKGHAALQSQEERVRAMKTLVPEATVLLGDSKDFLAPVREVKPDLILLGYDQTLPPGVSMGDFPCSMERAEPFEPGKYKSSILRNE